MGRPKGSKNKSKYAKIENFDRIVDYFAADFICGYHIDGAEKLARRILEKIVAKKEQLERKYGNKL